MPHVRPPSSPPVRSNAPYRIRNARRRRDAQNLPPPIKYSTLTHEETAELDRRMQVQYRWNAPAKKFQLIGVKAQLEGVDSVIQAPTGAGKTAIVAGPHLWKSNVITVMIVPLLQLEDEMVTTFEKDFNLKAIAIHSQNGGLTNEKVEKILEGQFQVVITSPEMLQSPSFVKKLLRNPCFTRRVLSMVIDEAHCISHWGADFRKKYQSIAIARAFFPRGTPVIALSATLTPRVRRDVQSKLQFPQNNRAVRHYYNSGNDRSNVSIVVRACQHAMNSFLDLDFVIPQQIVTPEDIPKTWIYIDDINTGNDIVDHLGTLLEARGASRGLVRPFNATMSQEYRSAAMEKFREGSVRIMICTDAAGMGCNIRDIDIVVQWKLPGTFSSFVQRAGRAARGSDRHGLAVLLVEPSVYSIILGQGQSSKPRRKRGRTRGKKGASNPPAPAAPKKTAAERKEAKDYAVLHGVERGGLAKRDAVAVGVETPLDVLADDEGLCAFVQTTGCRRRVWAEVFDNDPNCLPTRPDGVLCCDNCSPQLLDRTRPGPPRAKKATVVGAAVKGDHDKVVQATLEAWRTEVFFDEFADSLLPPSSVLDDDLIALLACYRRLSYADLESILAHRWIWWTMLGQRLSELTATFPETDAGVSEALAQPVSPKRSSRRRNKAQAEPEWEVRFEEPEIALPAPEHVDSAAPRTPPRRRRAGPAGEFTFSSMSWTGERMTATRVKQAPPKKPVGSRSAAKNPRAPKKRRLDPLPGQDSDQPGPSRTPGEVDETPSKPQKRPPRPRKKAPPALQAEATSITIPAAEGPAPLPFTHPAANPRPKPRPRPLPRRPASPNPLEGVAGPSSLGGPPVTGYVSSVITAASPILSPSLSTSPAVMGPPAGHPLAVGALFYGGHVQGLGDNHEISPP